MISQTAEYALRAVVCLADRRGASATTQELANAAHVPVDYLAKVLQALGRMGIVTSQRGKRGGFTLSRAADELTILEVVNAVDPVQRIHSCPLKLKQHGTKLCPLHERIDAAAVMVEQAFGGTSIADLLNEPSTSRPLCMIRGAAHA